MNPAILNSNAPIRLTPSIPFPKLPNKLVILQYQRLTHSMATLAQFLLALIVVFSLTFFSQAGILQFEFPPQTDMATTGDAFFRGNDRIELTKNEASANLDNSFGWMTYNKSIPLWDNSSRLLANFSTHFQFTIGQGNDIQNGYGDGLAFFMAPFDLEQPLMAVGGGFGLFNATTFNGSFYQMVAVEFDTFKNYWDSDDNHVGIDVNSVFSQDNFSLGNNTDENLKDGSYWDAWIDYDGGAQRFQVFLFYNPGNNMSKPGSPILSYSIDLREFLPQSIKVGLSASTGVSTETHTVYAWNFSCEYSWEIPTSASPNNGSVGENPSPGIPGKNGKSGSSVTVILISVIAGVLAVCALIFISRRRCFRKVKRGEEQSHESDAELDEWFAQGPRRFSYAELSAATANFSEDEKLGQGGFGGVYRGVFPGTAETVAVKKISQGSKQGKKEYVSEVTIISKLRHRNLVQLLGWCHERGELLLVYEYLPNGSLDKYLFGEQKAKLDWDRRYSIACDIACALVYLHEEWDQRVVHRDVKASNVMLDADFNGKLGDFGLARLMKRDQGSSHTTVVAGTLGYLAPECVVTGKASPESDVYSFGAVTLEIACGRRAFDGTLIDHNCRLVEWVWDLYGQGKLLDAADQNLCGNFNSGEMLRLMLIGLLCSHPDTKARPTMREVTKILKLEGELPYVPLDFPVAVYGQHLRPSLTISSTSTSTDISGGGEISSVFSSSTASSGSAKMSSPLLFNTG